MERNRRGKRGSPPSGKKYMYICPITNTHFHISRLDFTRALLSLNRLLHEQGDVSLGEWYRLLNGPPDHPMGDLMGWSYDSGFEWGYDWLEIEEVPKSIDGVRYYEMRYISYPSHDYICQDYQFYVN